MSRQSCATSVADRIRDPPVRSPAGTRDLRVSELCSAPCDSSCSVSPTSERPTTASEPANARVCTVGDEKTRLATSVHALTPTASTAVSAAALWWRSPYAIPAEMASVTTLIAKASDVTVDAANPTLATTRKPAATARASHERYRGIDDAPCGVVGQVRTKPRDRSRTRSLHAELISVGYEVGTGP